MSRYQKGKTNLDFTEARDSDWQWNPLSHMQVCTSLQTDNQASTPPLSFLQAGCPSCHPTNSVKALKHFPENNRWTKSLTSRCLPWTELLHNRRPHGNSSRQTWNWVTGSMGHLGHLSRPGHRVIILTRCEIRVFPVFEKKCPKCKTYI